MCVQRRVCVARVSRATASRTYFGPRTCLGPRTWNISICAVHTFERRSGSGGHESVGCVVGFVAQMRTAMEGAHAQQRQLRDVLVGDAAEAAATRQRVQRGVAAAGRKGQAMQITTNKVPAEVRKEVAKAMQTGAALVQASIEHLDTAERSWDNWINERSVVVKRSTRPRCKYFRTCRRSRARVNGNVWRSVGSGARAATKLACAITWPS